MSITVSCPSGWEAQRAYACEVFFGLILGLPCRTDFGSSGDTIVRLEGAEGEIRLPDTFFSQEASGYHSARWLPTGKLTYLRVEDCVPGSGLAFDELPVLYGEVDESPGSAVGAARFPIDVLGTAFFLLSGYEEFVLLDRDEHGRFLASMSSASRLAYLHRPLLDETAELFWQYLRRMWPGLERRSVEGRVSVSCDVDRPYDPGRSTWQGLLGRVAGNPLRLGAYRKASNAVSAFLENRRGIHSRDPMHTFQWYMEQCEARGRQVEFYFLSDRPAGKLDCRYDIFERNIAALFRDIQSRGHGIQLHGSYRSIESPGQVRHEKERLEQALRLAGVETAVVGNRQHYLRWDINSTPDYLSDAGYHYDTTGGYPDSPGFKYGTARPFPMWSWRDAAALPLEQRPLVCMECSIISADYMGLGYSEEAYELVRRLKRRALRYGGDFTLLWHNSHLTTAEDRSMFLEFIS